jgi:hypothetical protein
VKPAAASGRAAEDPGKYAGCKPLDVALMRFIEGAGPGATEEENTEERHSQVPSHLSPYSNISLSLFSCLSLFSLYSSLSLSQSLSLSLSLSLSISLSLSKWFLHPLIPLMASSCNGSCII